MKRKMKTLASLLLALAMVLTACAGTPTETTPAATEAQTEAATEAEETPAVSENTYTDGTYTGTGTGMNGDVKVSVTVEGGKITAVEVTEQNETPGTADPALEQIPTAIVEAN